MPKLPISSPKKIVSILLKNGFYLDRTKGSHQIFRNPKTHKIAVVPMHKKDLPKGTMLEILRQAGISKEKITKLS